MVGSYAENKMKNHEQLYSFFEMFQVFIIVGEFGIQSIDKFVICTVYPSFRYAPFRLLLEKLNKSRNGA